jgi:predicted GIY-YIG superfamily endonuclease
VFKRFVYVLRNLEIPPKYYTGLTSDVARRLTEHNAGRCSHTADYGPWSVDVVIEFADERRAVALERYLKSGSGVAFANRHLR